MKIDRMQYVSKSIPRPLDLTINHEKFANRIKVYDFYGNGEIFCRFALTHWGNLVECSKRGEKCSPKFTEIVTKAKSFVNLEEMQQLFEQIEKVVTTYSKVDGFVDSHGGKLQIWYSSGETQTFDRGTYSPVEDIYLESVVRNFFEKHGDPIQKYF